MIQSKSRVRSFVSSRCLLTFASLGVLSCGGAEEKSEADRAYEDCVNKADGDPLAEMLCLQVKAQADMGQEGGLVGADEQSGANDPMVSGEFEACATGGAEASVETTSMLLVIDKSSSMNDNNKWNQASNAMVAFLQSPDTSGLSIGLRFYPDDYSEGGAGLCNQDDCNVESCAEPLVDSGMLNEQTGAADAQEARLVDAIQSTSAWSEGGRGTPTYAALAGGLEWGRAYQASHAGEKAIVVLVTDGEPNGCNDNNTAIAGLAGDAFQSDGIRTYAIGLEGSMEPQMDEIAQAGGTQEGIFIGSANAEQDLLDALTDIRGDVLSCEFPVPDAPDGEELNPNQVNVVLTTSGTDTQFAKVDGAEDCGSDSSWYYSGARIVLCPSACDATLADPNAAISLVFGCATGQPVTVEGAR